MRVCIHRGASEIGGNCVEIESQGRRIVLDVGLPLDQEPETCPLPPVPGFTAPDPSLLGVFLSHSHPDHCALASRLPKETLFLIGQAGRKILETASLFTPMGLNLANCIHIEDRKPVTLGPFTLTPYLVDHSAYDAYAVLVEADGQRLFYTGDFRAHGRKAALFKRLLAEPLPHVDVLLMEGTTIGRPDSDNGYPTERDLENRFVELFAQTPGMPLVWCSGQNIDRIVTLFRACKRSGRQLILDMYTAHVLRATGNARLPQADWEGVRVFLPKSQKSQVIRREMFDVANLYKADRIYPEQLAAAAPSSVMLFRPSMTRDLDEAACLEGASLICSVWRGYLEEERNRGLIDWLARYGIPLYHCHSSGHASALDLRRLRNAFAGTPCVPIHSECPDRFTELLIGSRRINGEWWEVTHSGNESAQT